MKYNTDKIRSDFPTLHRKINKKPLVYFDNAATNQKPVQVLERLRKYYENENSNIHRGVHYLSRKATAAFEQARVTVQSFVGAATPSEIIFTKGTTESINLVASSFGRKFVNEGDEILVTYMEHHSNIVPWQILCENTGANLKICSIKQNGELDMQDFRNKLSEKTRIAAITHVSNTLGTINPVKQLTGLAHAAGAYVLIDGAQAVAHLDVNVQDLDCDFYCFTGHKLYGPMGVGVLYGKEDILNKMPPYQSGGEMISKVTFGETTYNELPFKFEAGTPNVGGVLGLEAAIRYVNETGLEVIAAHENDILNYATRKLQTLGNIKIYGESKQKASVLSFNINEIHPYDTGTLIDGFGVAVRTGHLCTQPLTDYFGVAGFIRASFAMYNTHEEIDVFIEAVRKSMEMLL